MPDIFFLKVLPLASLLAVVPLLTNLAQGIEVRVASDVRGVGGSKAEVVCEVNDLDDPLEDCEFYGPDRRKVRDNDTNLRVIADRRRDECILRINK